MRVLISGAGVAGPTVAWFLAKAGAIVKIVEKAPALLAQGQNVDLEGSAITAVKKMGLFEELKRWHTTEVGTRLIDRQGRPFAEFPVSAGASATNQNEILRSDLSRIVYEATTKLTNINYCFGTTVTSVLQNDEEAIKVKFSTGEEEAFDIVIAADGQWSKVRSLVFKPEDVRVVDKGMYAIYWTIPRIPEDDTWWNLYLAEKRRIITLRPDPHGTTRAMFSYMPATDAEKHEWNAAARAGPEAQQLLLKRVFADAGWQAQRLLDSMASASDFYFQELKQIWMNEWSSGRVVLLGDAAWAPTPLAGGGAHAAFTGAYLLAGEVSKLQEGEHPRKAFHSFQNVFQKHVDESRNIPNFVPRIVHADGALHRRLLEGVASTMSKTLNLWAKPFDSEANDNGFKLPEYPTLKLV